MEGHPYTWMRTSIGDAEIEKPSVTSSGFTMTVMDSGVFTGISGRFIRFEEVS